MTDLASQQARALGIVLGEEFDEGSSIVSIDHLANHILRTVLSMKGYGGALLYSVRWLHRNEI